MGAHVKSTLYNVSAHLFRKLHRVFKGNPFRLGSSSQAEYKLCHNLLTFLVILMLAIRLIYLTSFARPVWTDRYLSFGFLIVLILSILISQLLLSHFILDTAITIRVEI